MKVYVLMLSSKEPVKLSFDERYRLLYDFIMDADNTPDSLKLQEPYDCMYEEYIVRKDGITVFKSLLRHLQTCSVVNQCIWWCTEDNLDDMHKAYDKDSSDRDASAERK